VNSVSFTVAGAARGKGSVRSGVSKGGKLIHFKDEKTASYMTLVKWSAAAAMKARPPLAGPLLVLVTIRLAPPVSTPKRSLPLMLANELLPTKKPDVDNVLKAIFDGCKGVTMTDDVQVCDLHVQKVYSETPGVDVVFEEMRPAVTAVAA
jgi:Holliday junction resolvase RusA-like endonuclease